MKLHNCVKNVMKNKNILANVIEEEYSGLGDGDESPETASLLSILRKKREQEAERNFANSQKRMSQAFPK